MSDKYQNAVSEAQINVSERSFGPQMSEEDVANHFGETLKPEPTPTLDEDTQELIDIYRIKARVGNHVTETGGALTSQGTMLVNTYVHVLKSLYGFAITLKDETEKKNLLDLIKGHETMPRDLIKAAGAGVKPGKGDEKN